MIAKLTGKLDSVGRDHAVVDVGGVGYLLRCSARTLAALPAPGGAVSLAVETLVREDAIELVGFPGAAERDWFRLLMTVQGVGAKVALALLSALPPDDLARAIALGDRAQLTRAEGVGPKLASRLANELKEKVAGMDLPASVAAAAAAVPVAGAGAEALSALLNLGYRRAEAIAALEGAQRRLGGEATVENLIRAGLRELSA